MISFDADGRLDAFQYGQETSLIFKSLDIFVRSYDDYHHDSSLTNRETLAQILQRPDSLWVSVNPHNINVANTALPQGELDNMFRKIRAAKSNANKKVAASQ